MYVLMIYLENYCIVFLIYSVTILSLTSLNSCNHIVLDATQIYYNIFVKQNLRLNNSNLHEISPSTTVNIPQLFCGKSNNQCLNNVHMEHTTTLSTDSNPHNQTFKHSNWQFNNRHQRVLNRRKFGIIEYVFSREDAGTYTCRARVPQTGIKPTRNVIGR